MQSETCFVRFFFSSEPSFIHCCPVYTCRTYRKSTVRKIENNIKRRKETCCVYCMHINTSVSFIKGAYFPFSPAFLLLGCMHFTSAVKHRDCSSISLQKINYAIILCRFFLFLLLSRSLSQLSCLFLPLPLPFQYNGSSQCARILCLAITNPAHIRLHHWPFLLWYSICTYGCGANIAVMQKERK